jgi:hypothetical protein
MGVPFRQHLFDFTPLLEQELFYDLDRGIIRETIIDTQPNHGQEGVSGLTDNMHVLGRPPVQEKFEKNTQSDYSLYSIGLWQSRVPPTEAFLKTLVISDSIRFAVSVSLFFIVLAESPYPAGFMLIPIRNGVS